MVDEKVRQAVGYIAAHLPEWNLLDEGPYDNAAYLEGPSGVRVRVSGRWDESRLNFSISLENGLYNFEPYQAKRPEAGVSMDRDPKAAAKDVKRRCLDPAVPYVLELRDKKAKSDAVKNARWTLLETLAEASGGKVIHSYNDSEDPLRADVRRGNHDHPSIEMEVTSGECLNFQTYEYGPDRVNVEIRHLEMADALALCQWLRFQLWPENGQQGTLL